MKLGKWAETDVRVWSGAQEIGIKLCEQVKELIEQMSKHLEEDMVLDASTSDDKKPNTNEKPTSSGAIQR